MNKNDDASTEKQDGARPWTAGPWRADSNDGTCWRVLACDPRATIVCDGIGAFSNKTALADARLIAAAPDLFEVAAKPMVYVVEQDEAVVRLSIGGVEVCAYPADRAEARVLLLFAADQAAALSRALPQEETK